MNNEKGAAGKAAGVELYTTDRYFALTNEHLSSTPRTLRKADDAVQRLVGRLDQMTRAKANPEDAATAKARKDTAYTVVNDVALQHLDSWVPEVFPEAVPQGSTGGYRVSSASLGRDLEEDLGITPQGIVDWGLHDLPGEERQGKRTPIDLVIEHGRAANARQAAEWLAQLIGIEEEFAAKLNGADPKVDEACEEHIPGGEEEEPGSAKTDEDAPSKPPLPFFQGTSYRNQARREPLIKRLLGVGELSIWYGAPKTGKSFLVTDAALAVAAAAEQWFSYRVK
jgi:hypothetical protein